MAQRGMRTLEGLKRTTLREQCLEALRTAITSGQLPPGEHLVEADLSEVFGVSRGTLREALRRLEQEGLVVAGSRGRLSVRTISQEEVADIYRVRAALEALAAGTVTTAQDRDEKVAKLAKSAKNLAEVEGDMEHQIEADLAFHRLLCELTENETLVKTWLTLEGPIRMTFMHAGPENALRNMSSDRHTALVDIIAAGDAIQAQQAVIDHMNEAAKRLYEAFKQHDMQPSPLDLASFPS